MPSTITAEKTESRPDLSVVLITYNHKDYIAQCLESVLSQETTYSYEIMVIDDCSIDGTSEIVRIFKERYPGKIRHYRSEKNIGHGRKAMYVLNSPTRGRYWCHLEGDDYWISNKKIQKQLNFLEGSPDFIGCTHNYVILEEQKEKKIEQGPFLDIWTIEDMALGKFPLYSHTSTWIWRNLYHVPGQYNLHLPAKMNEPDTYGDTCLYFFMANHGGGLKKLDETMSCYRMTGKGLWSQLTIEERNKYNNEIYTNLDKITDFKYSKYFKNRQHQPLWIKRLFKKAFRKLKKVLPKLLLWKI